MLHISKAVTFDPDKKKILIVKRSEDDTNPGKWEFPGGGIQDEEPLIGVIRELGEETGINPKSLRKEGTGDLKTDGRTFRFHVFRAVAENKDVELSWEHSDYEWIEPGEHNDYDTIDGFEKDLEIATGNQ